MKTFLSRLLLAVPVLALSLSSAQAAEAPQALQRFLDNVKNLEANFTQVQSDDQGKATQNSSGQFWLQRGTGSGQFRWNYNKPYVQEIVCDGQRIWLYDPDLSQVTVRPAAEALQGTPAALLAQKAVLTNTFTAKDAGSENGLRKIALTPKSADSEFRSIELWLTANDAPARMRFEDPLGGSTDIKFSNVKLNGQMRTDLFGFKPPKGVEIVDAGGK